MELLVAAVASKVGSVELTPQSKCCLLFSLYPRRLTERMHLRLVLPSAVPDGLDVSDFSALGFKSVQALSPEEVNEGNSPGSLPVLRSEERRLVWVGFASVIRAIVNVSCEAGCCVALRLLGLHKACLKACKEVSKWTLFCERTLPDQLAQALTSEAAGAPPCLEQMRQTFHLDAPIANRNKRLHVRKKAPLAQDQSGDCARATGRNLRPIGEFDSRLPGTHRYLEGPRQTLVDVVAAFFIGEAGRHHPRLKEQATAAPELRQWLFYLAKDADFVRSCEELRQLRIDWRVPMEPPGLQLLHSKDADEFSSIVRGVEKMKIGGALAKELSAAVEAFSALAWTAEDVEDRLAAAWPELPPFVNPREGQVPPSRLARKCQQLGSIVSAALSLARPGDTLVDFCCGGGHVGLLLAHLLPDCRVILLENKEESLMRAERRIASSAGRLANVLLFKCNLTDFRSTNFQLGVALHACGTATDLVMDACAAAGASFVISPCCYGSIKPNALAGRFPRSSAFRRALGGLESAQPVFARLTHGADITDREHALWGTARRAMAIVDSDRLWRAQEGGRFAALSLRRMVPEGCSPKDHLLIGEAASL